MDRYPPIAEHGLIGDLQTAALVTTDGTVDWWCCPRFDSPSVFASLLDHDNGGRFRIGPEGDDYVARQLYFPDTAILITRFMTPDGVGEVIDFMPVHDPHRASDRHRLVRVVRCVRGRCALCSTARRGSTTAGSPTSWSSPTRARSSALRPSS
jgi:GH15 family glucan-1,4-alpha-glucosidase